MKKSYSITVCILLLCSSLLIVGVGTVMGFAAGYEITEYWASAATIDGKWTTSTEWSTGRPYYIGTTQKGMFIMQANTAGGYAPEYLIEFADSTLNAGDIIQVCMNGGADSSAPTAADFKFEIQGLTTKKVYQGTGTGWAESTTAAAAVKANATRTTTVHDPALHVVAEFSIDKATLAGWGAPPLGLRIACYDASTGNWVSWPPTSQANVSSTWGQISGFSSDPYPEGLTIPLMVLVSTVAVLSTSYYLRRRSKI